jgi:hydroxyacylglutathione hydrolase
LIKDNRYGNFFLCGRGKKFAHRAKSKKECRNPMFFQCISTPGLSIHSYLLGDENTKRCVVVDPTRHVVPFIMQAQNAGLDITDILETHVHADFVSGSKELKHQLNGKPCIYASGMGGDQWIPVYTDVVVQNGTEIKLNDLRIEALHTPGHTQEHVIWICYDESRSSTIPWFAFTGDCIFVGSIGRPDLLGKSKTAILAPLLYQTIFEVLAPLPDFLEILPTHGEGSLCGKALSSRPTSTLGFERLFNPYFKKESQEIWIQNLQKGLLPAPAYFQRLKKSNVQGPPLLNSLKVEIWEKNKDAPSLKELFLMDIRHPEPFAASHIVGSLNIPFSHSFCLWAGWMLPPSQHIGLILENSHVYSEPVDQLRLMGFDQDVWVIQLGDHLNDLPFSTFPIIEVEELAQRHQPDSIYLLDVRTPEEWFSGHISGAHHLELNELEKTLKQLPKDQSIALICRSGQRASLGASLLRKNGFSSVMNVRGGMQAWKQAGLPLKRVSGKC